MVTVVFVCAAFKLIIGQDLTLDSPRLIGGGGLMVERMTGSSWIVCDVYVVVMLRAI